MRSLRGGNEKENGKSFCDLIPLFDSLAHTSPPFHQDENFATRG